MPTALQLLQLAWGGEQIGFLHHIVL